MVDDMPILASRSFVLVDPRMTKNRSQLIFGICIILHKIYGIDLKHSEPLYTRRTTHLEDTCQFSLGTFVNRFQFDKSI